MNMEEKIKQGKKFNLAQKAAFFDVKNKELTGLRNKIMKTIKPASALYIYFDENRVVKHFTYNVPAAPGSLDLVIVAERNRRKQQSQNNDQLNNNHMTPGNFRTGF